MNYYSKVYEEDEDGFNGNCEAYSIETDKENLFNWLSKEINDAEILYKIIQELTSEILIIKNINVEEDFRGQGNGIQILCDLINDSYATAAILLCDIGENQKEGFILEKFYEENNFKTIMKKDNYPLMVFPSELAEKIIDKLSHMQNKNKVKI